MDTATHVFGNDNGSNNSREEEEEYVTNTASTGGPRMNVDTENGTGQWD